MNKILLISPTLVKETLIINNNIDDKYIESSILYAQDAHLTGILGFKQYQDLLNTAYNDQLSGSSYEPCWNTIESLLLYATEYELLKETYTQLGVKGLTQQTDENTVIANPQLYGMKLGEIKKKISFYTTQLINYVKDNQTNFMLMLDITGHSEQPDPLEGQSGWYGKPYPIYKNMYER